VVDFTPDGGDQLVNGRYRLVETIGRGGMGTVWRGHDEMLDREVAIKRVLFEPGLDEEERAELTALAIQEARATARLNHPGIVTIFDVIEDDGAPVIVMEFVDGRSLADILREEVRLPYRRVAEIGAAVLEALRAAHDAGIVHRDLKPANILISGRRVVITDFGVAQRVGERADDTEDVLGTPAFMAPEQVENAAASPAADLWSLGATLFNAVEGRPPFEGPDYATVLLTLLTQEAPATVNAGPLAPLITSLLRRDPARRPSAEDVAARLAAILDDGGPSVVAAMRNPAADPSRSTPTAAGASRPRPAAPSAPAPAPTSVGRSPYASAGLGQGAPPPGLRAAPPRGVRPAHDPHARSQRSMVVRQIVGGAAVTLFLIGVLIYAHAHDPSSVGAGMPSQPPESVPSYPFVPPTAGPSSPPYGPTSDPGFLATAISPDGRTVAFAGGSGVVRLYDTISHKSKAHFDAYTDSDQVISALAFSPDGRTVAVGLGYGAVETWDLAKHQMRPLSDLGDGATALRFGADGRTLTAIGDHGRLGTWSLGTGGSTAATETPSPGLQCRTATLSRDGRRAACATEQDGVVIMNVNGAGRETWLPDVVVQNFGLAFSPDGRTLALDAGPEGKDDVQLWDIASQKRTVSLHSSLQEGGNALTFSPDGTMLAVPVYDAKHRRDAVELRRASDGTRIATLAEGVHEVTRLAFSPGGGLLAVAHAGGGQLWDVRAQVRLSSWTD
jgi:serine/threonine protein kinase